MKILILCAGVGSRLGKLTEKSPKCLIKVNSGSILNRLLIQLHKYGLNNKDIYLCAGYRSNMLPENYIKFINTNYMKTNMLTTTYLGLLGIKEFSDNSNNILVIYGDCLYSDKTIFEILNRAESTKNFLIPIDLDWEEKWKNRYNDIYSDAETLKFDKSNNKLLSIGLKTLIKEDYMGQFMGTYIIPKSKLEKFTELCDLYNIKSSNQISTTEFLNSTLSRFNYFVMPGRFKWSEIDTKEDLFFAKKLFS